MTTSEYGLEIRNLRKVFGDVIALDGINLEIPKGHIVGLLGQNGAGKSTLVRLLSGVMKPSEGNALVNGYDLINEVDQVKRVTGLLPEEYALYEKLSIYEYLEFLASLYDLEDNLFQDRFQRLMKRLEIEELGDRLIDTLSKGQKQKVAVIASLIHEPTILFLDEPLANLDVYAQREVREIIREYKADNRTIMIATHLLSNVESTCDMIIVIHNGKIKFNGILSDFKTGYNDLEEAYINYIGGIV